MSKNDKKLLAAFLARLIRDAEATAKEMTEERAAR